MGLRAVASGGSAGSGLPNVVVPSGKTLATALPNFRAAMGKVSAGMANSAIVLVGDSTTRGTGSNNSASGNWFANAMPTKLTSLLNTQYSSTGISFDCQSFIGTGGTSFDVSSTDPRMSVGSGWVFTSQTSGGAFYSANGVTGNLAFTPIGSVDTMIIYYAKGVGFGKFHYNTDGGSNTIVDTSNASNALGTVTINPALGTHTVNINWDSVASVFIIGVVAYNSANSGVRVINAGSGSSKVADWNLTPSTAWGPMKSASSFGSSLIILALAINDWNAGTALSTYQTNYQTLITQFLTVGDVILWTGFASDPSTHASVATQQSYVNVAYSLAASNGLILVDTWAREGAFATYNPLGIGYDGVHLNGAGYLDIAKALLGVLIP